MCVIKRFWYCICFVPVLLTLKQNVKDYYNVHFNTTTLVSKMALSKYVLFPKFLRQFSVLSVIGFLLNGQK